MKQQNHGMIPCRRIASDFTAIYVSQYCCAAPFKSQRLTSNQVPTIGTRATVPSASGTSISVAPFIWRAHRSTACTTCSVVKCCSPLSSRQYGVRQFETHTIPFCAGGRPIQTSVSSKLQSGAFDSSGDRSAGFRRRLENNSNSFCVRLLMKPGNVSLVSQTPSPLLSVQDRYDLTRPSDRFATKISTYFI